MHPKNRIGYLKKRRGIVGLEAAIVLIAFVIIAAAFSFMVVNQGLFATERGKTVIQEGLKQASTPLTMDGSTFVRTTADGKNVDVIVIPLRAFGVKYVAMWKNETVVSMKVGKSAWANVYGGVMYTKDVNVEAEDVGPGDGLGNPYPLDNGPVIIGSDRVYIEDTFDGTGAQLIFNLLNTPTSFSERIFVEGILQSRGVDYTIADKVITFAVAPPVGAGNVVVYYETAYTMDHQNAEINFVELIVAATEIWADYSYRDVVEQGTCDPSGKKFDELVGLVYDPVTKHYDNGVYVDGAAETVAVLALENSNGDESLDSFEKGYLIVTLACEDAAKVRDAITIEVRLEKTAPLSIEFNIPEAMPKDTWVMT